MNMGCPAPKIVKNGEGSCLMKTPELVGKIVRSLVESQKKPVTIKFRKGFDEEHINAVEIAKIAEANGASAVAVHGRTREQYYSGKADWDIIREVKAAAVSYTHLDVYKRQGTPCTCMRRRLMDRLYDQSNVRDVIKLENFDTFDLRLFDTEVVPAEGISPKENAQRNLKKAMEFAEHRCV